MKKRREKCVDRQQRENSLLENKTVETVSNYENLCLVERKIELIRVGAIDQKKEG